MATIRYLVRDVDEALAFYEALGFEVSERWGPPFAMVARGDLTLWLSGPGSSAAKPLPGGRTPEPGGWNRIQIAVDDLEALVAALRPKGARFRSEILTGFGGKQIVVDDPSGNPVELFEGGRRG